MPVNSVLLCRLANSLFARPPLSWAFRVPASGPRTAAHAYAEWEFDQAGAGLAFFGRCGDPKDRRVLDVGCGFGGKSAYLARSGARRVTGIDTDPDRIEAATDFAARMALTNVSYEVRDITNCDCAAATFDLIFLVDVVEHLSDPFQALSNCHRLLDQGGRLLVCFPPYGSPWGSHLIPHVRVPWASSFFTEQAVLAVWRHCFQQDAVRQGVLSAQRRRELSESRNVREIWGLNIMTIRRFEELVAQLPFKVVMKRPHALWSLPAVARLPGLRERFVTRYVVVLEKG